MGKKIITIGRQFGSGGHEIGDRVSGILDIPLYDRKLVEMASVEMGVDEYSLEQVDEAALGRFLTAYRIPDEPNSVTGYGMALNDSMFVTQSAIIERLALTKSCVIVGRCADYVLRENPDCLNIFICASEEERIKRIRGRYELSEKEAAEAVKKADKGRKKYYETYSGKKWGSKDSHQVILNVSLLGMERVVDIICDLYRTMGEDE